MGFMSEVQRYRYIRFIVKYGYDKSFYIILYSILSILYIRILSSLFLYIQVNVPLQVSEKIAKRVEEMLAETGIGLRPMPTAAVVKVYNELRQDMVTLLELRRHVQQKDYELQLLKGQKQVRWMKLFIYYYYYYILYIIYYQLSIQ